LLVLVQEKNNNKKWTETARKKGVINQRSNVWFKGCMYYIISSLSSKEARALSALTFLLYMECYNPF
jgi:hypothetical protein